MKKITLFALISISLFGCENNDEIVSHETKDTSKTYLREPVDPNFPQQNSTIISFLGGIASYDSGCTMEILGPSGWTTNTGVFGGIPQTRQDGYVVRGYGKPYHNQYYNCLILRAENHSSIMNSLTPTGHSRGSAISIEYTFLPNKTYEIAIDNYFVDNRKILDDVYSNGYPSLFVELRDSAVIEGPEEPCTENSLCWFEWLEDSYFYRRHQTLDSHALINRTFIYTFSPLVQKNAILVALRPHHGDSRDVIPTNNYTMKMPRITITEKPFDPSINVIPPRGTFY